MPRHLSALGHVVDAQANAVEHLGQRQPPVPHHFCQRLSIRPIRTRSFSGYSPRRGVVGDEQTRLWLDQRQAAGERRARPRKRVWPRRIENGDGCLQLQRCQRPQIVGHAYCTCRHVRVSGNSCIDRDKVVLAFKLKTVSTKINECDRIRPRGRGLFEEIAKAASQRILIKVTRAHHVETCRLQGLGDQTGVIGSVVERTSLISGIADYERNTVLGVCRSGRNQAAE